MSTIPLHLQDAIALCIITALINILGDFILYEALISSRSLPLRCTLKWINKRTTSLNIAILSPNANSKSSLLLSFKIIKSTSSSSTLKPLICQRWRHERRSWIFYRKVKGLTLIFSKRTYSWTITMNLWLGWGFKRIGF